MTFVKMRTETLFMTILMDGSWAETLGSASNIILANGGGLPRRLGQRVIRRKITKWRCEGGDCCKTDLTGFFQVICCQEGNEKFHQIAREGGGVLT